MNGLEPSILPRGVIVLYSARDEPVSAASKDWLADQETISTAHAVAAALRDRTSLEVHLVSAAHRVDEKLAVYPPRDYWVFNLFEGLDEPSADVDGVDDEARAAYTLEALGYRFTGARGSAVALAVNKAKAKERLEHHGVVTPKWRVFASADQVSEESLRGLGFPLIAKPVAEDSSLGIGTAAVASDLDHLRARVADIVSAYRQPALVEAFIDGREINVALWGDPPDLLPVAEIDLSAFSDPLERIVGFRAKWEEESFEYHHTPAICPARLDKRLEAQIQDVALRAWWACCGSGYGRVDMRVQGDRAYVLEVNPNPSLAPDAGFARAARAGGYDYAEMVLHILSLAGKE